MFNEATPRETFPNHRATLPDDGWSISRNVASLNILVKFVIITQFLTLNSKEQDYAMNYIFLRSYLSNP